MARVHYLQQIVATQKEGTPLGIYSVCSAHEFVLEAAMRTASKGGGPLLIEATSNQVNQFGGYTGMRPADFRDFVLELAGRVGFPVDRLILGGDHLGPNPWKDETAESAMAKACAMVHEYAAAGYSKIHLDASMYLGDDPGERKERLDAHIIADRTARLCRAAEAGFAEWQRHVPEAPAPVYVIGSEVPVPGGAVAGHEAVVVTSPDDLVDTVAITESSFTRAGLEAVFQRVVAVVVQPGVEFGDGEIHEYDPAAARDLSVALKRFPNLVFEGHSTDYQTREALTRMVADGVAILKVGPGLTFAMREALFALSYIEDETLADEVGVVRSGLRDALEAAMLTDPGDWNKYYRGTEADLRMARKYSLSDRSRYYWGKPAVLDAVRRLLANLGEYGIPLPLLSQFMPVQYTQVRLGRLPLEPRALVLARVQDALADYAAAVTP